MKLLKILLLILLIFVLVIFFYQNYSLNPDPIWIWLYPSKEFSIPFPLLMAFGLMIGVIVGFATAVFQIFTHKRQVRLLKSQVKKLRSELDSLRNQSIDDEILLSDTTETVDS
ncbi:MAG: LapA family protein [Candidatus Marinimicrobia bacterium]|nr:LapA family protein [Candidatus Neomarinimicrobiota bacterium]